MSSLSCFTSRLPSLRATLAAAMVVFTLAAAPLSQTLAVARVESADNQNSSERFTLVVVSGWDETSGKSDEASTPRNENKPAKHPSILRPLSDQWDTAKVVQFNVDVPAEITLVQPGSVALIEAQPAPQPVFAPPHNPIRPGRAPPKPA